MNIYEIYAAFKPRHTPLLFLPHEMGSRAKIRKRHGSVNTASRTAAVFTQFSLAARSDPVLTEVDNSKKDTSFLRQIFVLIPGLVSLAAIPKIILTAEIHVLYIRYSPK
jgi:hypothetical protein